MSVGGRGAEVAVVVPTFNRKSLLLRLLSSLERQTLAPGRFEVVVVDNNSRDGTGAAVQEFARSAPTHARLLHEPQQGASHARNRGIRETTAPVLAFTDDDVEAEPGWLEESLRGLEVHRAAVVGGRTIPLWGLAFPSWWHPDYEHAFSKDWGLEPRRVTEFPFFYSHNLVARREPLLAAGLFETRFGPKASRHLVGEDADLCRRLHEAGETLYYVPAAVVRHYVEPERMSRGFLRRRHYYGGMTHALHHAVQSRPLQLPYQIKVVVTESAKWLSARDPRERFRAELKVRYRVGFLLMGLRLTLRAAEL